MPLAVPPAIEARRGRRLAGRVERVARMASSAPVARGPDRTPAALTAPCDCTGEPPAPALPDVPSLNVLMVNTYQSGGGAGRAAQLLAKALRERGDGVNAIVAHDAEGDSHCRRADHWREAPLVRTMHRLGLTDIARPSSLLWHCRGDFAAADVLHLHNLHGDYLSILALPLWGRLKPMVWTLHDMWALTGNCAAANDCDRWRRGCGRCPKVGLYPLGPRDRTAFYRRLKPRLFAAARPLLVTPSRWLADRVGEVPEYRRLTVRVIPHAIDASVFKPSRDRATERAAFGLHPDHPTVVMAGHTWNDPLKGADRAIAALRAARERVPGLQLLISGAGGDWLLKAAGIAGMALPFVRARSTLAAAYACADVCLFPSLAETCGLVALESLACETPVVAHRVGGIPEQIQHGRTGLLADERCPGELAARLIALLCDKTAALTMGRSGRRFVLEHRSIDGCLKAHRAAYADAVHTWRRRYRRQPRRERGTLGRLVACALGWEERSDKEAGE